MTTISIVIRVIHQNTHDKVLLEGFYQWIKCTWNYGANLRRKKWKAISWS